MEILKLLAFNEVVAQTISFLILLIILRAFLWKRVLKTLDDRKERIASEFKTIEDGKKDIERIKADYENRIGAIEETAKERIREAVGEGNKIVEDLKKKAQSDAQRILDQAKADIKDEVKKAREGLRGEVVGLALKATERIVEEKLAKETDKKLVEDFLKKIDEVK